MKKYRIIIQALILSLYSSASAEMFDLKIKEIKDSASFLQKIAKSDNPLFSYFANAKASMTKNDIVNVINTKVISTTDFAYKVTQMSELKIDTAFENLSKDRKRGVMAQNRDLLTELFPDEIVERNPEVIRQSIGLHVKINKVESIGWLKAEIVNFFNDVLCNEKIMENWVNMKAFFDSSVSDQDVKLFVEELRLSNIHKIPINSIEIKKNQNSDLMDIVIKDKNNLKQKILFTVTMIPGKKWKILRAKNISNDLSQAGYMTKKEVRR